MMMNIEIIRQKLQHFYDGTSTAEEEEELMEFFAHARELPEDLMADKMMFASMSRAKSEEQEVPDNLEERLLAKVDEWEKATQGRTVSMTDAEDGTKKGKVVSLPFLKSPVFRHIAASVAIVAGLGIYFATSYDNDTQIAYDKDTYSNPDEAYEKSAKALALFSRAIETGERGVDKAEAQTANIINKLDKYIQ
jgi:hypothetical protein